MLWPSMRQYTGQNNIRRAAWLEQQKSGIPRGEPQEFEWTLFRALCTQIAAEDAARKAADDAACQASSNQKVQDDQGDGQEVNEDPDPVQTVQQDFRYPWNFVSTQASRSWQTPRVMRYSTPSVTTGTGNGQSAWSGQSSSTVILPRMTWTSSNRTMNTSSASPRKRTSGNMTNSILMRCTSALNGRTKPSERIGCLHLWREEIALNRWLLPFLCCLISWLLRFYF